MIDIEAERARFEAWFLQSWNKTMLIWKVDCYLNSITNLAWAAWLAAKRDAITNEVSDEQAAG